MLDPARESRIVSVAAERLSWVRCAFEHVFHRHNTSAMLRTCDALGVHRVHLVGEGEFVASKGPARGADRWLELHRHASTADAVRALKAAGVALWVADLAEPPVPPAAVPVDRPVCLWFGAEVLGVSPEAREAADGIVTIPMHGFAQSLNVSVAAALTLHVVTERARTAHGDAALLPPDERVALLADWLAREEQDLAREVLVERATRALGLQLPP